MTAISDLQCRLCGTNEDADYIDLHAIMTKRKRACNTEGDMAVAVAAAARRVVASGTPYKCDRFIALLRGINVGGVRVNMKDLKSLMEQLGYSSVQTILATGNVIFTAAGGCTTSEIREHMEHHLSKRFNYGACVQVYDVRSICSAVDNYKFEKKNGQHAYLVFINERSTFYQMKEEYCSEAAPPDSTERVLFFDEVEDCLVVNWEVPIGCSTSTRFAKLISKTKFKNAVTTRNINTLEKILQVAKLHDSISSSA